MLNITCISWRIVVQLQIALNQFDPPLTRDFLSQTSQFVYRVRTIYGKTLQWLSSDYQKNEAIIFPFELFSEGVGQGASIACSVFFWIEVMDTCLILSYDPIDKIRFILVARQTITWNVEPGPFLVRSISGRKLFDHT
jgi:hypothetical protein